MKTGAGAYRCLRRATARRDEGGAAPPAFAERTVLLWFVDVSEADEQASALRARLERRSAALEALSRLLELAPFPMWHRGPDLALAMVNSAYVGAVEAASASDVIARGLELVEAGPGRNPIAAAATARESGEARSRVLPATVGGERRSLMVVDVPLGDAGVAGYAIDVEELEQARGAFKRFEEAQRDLLDRLSHALAEREVLDNREIEEIIGPSPTRGISSNGKPVLTERSPP